MALNDAARDYRNMREQPAAVQRAVLAQLRQERADNLEARLALTEELQAINATGTRSTAVAQRRNDILLEIDRLEWEDNTLRQASVAQLGAMNDAGVTRAVQHPEWAEGAGANAMAQNAWLGGNESVKESY